MMLYAASSSLYKNERCVYEKEKQFFLLLSKLFVAFLCKTKLVLGGCSSSSSIVIVVEMV